MTIPQVAALDTIRNRPSWLMSKDLRAGRDNARPRPGGPG